MNSIREVDSNEDDDLSFSFALDFGASECPDCGETGEPGPCPRCGTDMPPADPNGAVNARIAALGLLASQADTLETAFAELGVGGAPLSADQFLSVVSELEVFQRADEACRVGQRLQAYDFSDSKAVGSSIRRDVIAIIGELEDLLGRCRAVARFDPEGPGRELQERVISIGRWSAALVSATLGALIAPTLPDARASQSRIQALMDEGYGDDAGDLYDRLVGAARIDPSDRISLALGKQGDFVDELGFIDFASTFGAFSDESLALTSLGAAARGYFQNVLPHDVAIEGAVLLALPMVALAARDRPLSAHQVLWSTSNLLDRAWNTDPLAAAGVLRNVGRDTALVTGAAVRAEKGLRLLALGEQHGIDETTALTQVLNAYVEIVEGPLRTYVWALADLQAVIDGTDPSVGDPPELGKVSQRVAPLSGSLFTRLTTATNSALRNAAAHSQYEWDPGREELRDLRKNRTWTIHELEQIIVDLGETVAGLDAALACFAVRPEVEALVDTGDHSAPAFEFVFLFVAGLFAAAGLTLREADPGFSEFIVDQTAITPGQAVPILGGLAAWPSKDARTIDITSVDDTSLITVDVAEIQRIGSADPDLKDLELAVLSCRLDHVNHREPDEIVAILALLVSYYAMTEAVEAQGFGSAYLHRLIHRLEWLHGTATSLGADTARIRAVISAAYGFRSQPRRSTQPLIRKVIALQQWASRQEPAPLN